MLRYLLRRILLALPTLLAISLITFGLNKCADADPVQKIYGDYLSKTLDPEAQGLAYRQNAALLGLDKPVFYFSLTEAAFPDTLYRVFPPDRHKRLRWLTADCGDWPAVSRYEAQLSQAIRTLERTPDSLPRMALCRYQLSKMLIPKSLASLSHDGDSLALLAESLREPAPVLAARLDSLRIALSDMAQRQPGWPVPSFRWYGFDNQYHHWLSGFSSGNLGVSFISRKPVWDDLGWYVAPTLFLNGLAILISYLLAVPLGVEMARRRRKLFDNSARRGLLLLYAVPVFWLGSLLILFFATPGFGLHWIDGVALEPWQGSNKTFVQWVSTNASKFVLPVAALALHTLAVLAMQMRGGMLDVLDQDYIRTARAKGLDEEDVHWSHAFRNALFPIITVFASVFPAVFAGSLVIEYLFQFPGMGLKTQQAFMENDLPVLFAILMFSAILTIVGNLVADLLFAWVDPRVRLGKRA